MCLVIIRTLSVFSVSVSNSNDYKVNENTIFIIIFLLMHKLNCCICGCRVPLKYGKSYTVNAMLFRFLSFCVFFLPMKNLYIVDVLYFDMISEKLHRYFYGSMLHV